MPAARLVYALVMSVHCGECKAPIPDGFREGPPERDPCPACGSRVRASGVSLGAGEFISVGEAISTVHGRDGEHGSHAGIYDNNDVRVQLTGKSPTNEEDADTVCNRLVSALNASGEAWTAPTGGTGDVDFFAHDRNDPTTLLNIQVVRASIDGTLWRALGVSGSVDRMLDANDLADELLAAIKKKALKYPVQSQRSDLTLALDATRLPGHTFQPVLDSFKARHLGACTGYGFQRVLLVGPRDELVFRLDG